MNENAKSGDQAVKVAANSPGMPSSFERSMQFDARPVRRRSIRLVSMVILCVAVAVPILFGLYYGYFATDRYVSTAQFSIRAGGEKSSLPDALTAATGVASASGMLGALQDAFVVREFIHSQELVDIVHRDLDLVRIFGTPSADWWSRLDPDSTREEMHTYWQRRVSADLDATAGVVTLTVSAFTPAESLALTQHILQASQALVNRLSEQARQDSLAFASSEVRKAEDRLRDARLAVTAYRKKTGDIFPEATAQAQLELVAQLNLELAKAKAELAGMGLDRRSPTQRAAVGRIAALENQIETERRKLTAEAAHPGSGEPLSDLLIEYQALEVDRVFAEQFYMNTLSLLEMARQDALKTQRYLVVFVQPGLAEEPTEPRRGWAVLTVIGCTLAAYIILGVLYKTVREHVV